MDDNLGPKSEDAPIVVIGAGSTGTSTAYQLASAGRRVIVVEQGPQVASGMTSLSSAIVRTHYTHEILARMALYSLGVLSDFGHIGESGFVNSGLLIVAPANMRQLVTSNVEMLNRVGARNEIWDRDTAMRRFPDVNYEGCDLIDFEPASGYADPVGTANGFARAARERGAEFVYGRRVARLETEKGMLNSVLLDDGTRIACSHTMLCTNVWTNGLLAASGVKDVDKVMPLTVSTHSMAVYGRPERYHGTMPVIWDYPNKMYYKPDGSRLVSAGSMDPEHDRGEIDPDRRPSEVFLETLDSYSRSISERVPAMSEAVLHRSYIGLYDMTPDEQPIIDELSELGLGGVFCCVGLSGHGFKLSPAFGLMNAQMVLGQDESQDGDGRDGAVAQPIFDRSFFALSRFREGRLMRSKYSGIGTIG